MGFKIATTETSTIMRTSLSQIMVVVQETIGPADTIRFVTRAFCNCDLYIDGSMTHGYRRRRKKQKHGPNSRMYDRKDIVQEMSGRGY